MCIRDSRVTLESPTIGFGVEAYRKRFMEVMTHNSRCKKKELMEIPQEPSEPLLADVELSYPVSYTHLDVYKRQRFHSGSWQSKWASPTRC